ncbi:MAG: GerW family sporulation protein [Clostridia bacterium]|nr:GerW family sporulation protein [Clostridia bacterium]
MSDNKISSLIDTTISNLRTVVDADTIIGTPLTVEGITLIPVSKVSFGMATGGSDFPNKANAQIFGGGGGAGVSINPVAFIAIKDGNVRMMPIYSEMTSLDKAINMAPELFDKVKTLFKKDKNKDENKE